MTEIKTICSLCGSHMTGSPCAKVISYGLCHTCGDSMRRSLAGEPVEMAFWGPGHHNKCVIDISFVDAAFIRYQTNLGRTEREIVKERGEDSP